MRRQVPTLTTGSYLLEAPLDPVGLLVGFHGYGENSERHLEQLRRIPAGRQWVLCSIQSLHLFYKSRSREVIGSWMTSQDREVAIDNNIHYVRSIVRALQREFGLTSPLVYCGFSQGVAMAYRAAAASGLPCAGLIALAGDLPPEIARDPRLPIPPVLLGRGQEDPWYTEDKMTEDLKNLQARTAVVPCVFAGGHEWHAVFVEKAGIFLEEIQTQAKRKPPE